MATGISHKSVGTQLSQAEWEAADSHNIGDFTTGRGASYVIAANDAPSLWASQSDTKLATAATDVAPVVEAAWALGYIVLLSPGNFTVSSDFTGVSGCELRGCGKSTILNWDHTLASVFTMTNLTYFRLQDFTVTIDSSTGGTSGTVAITTCPKWEIVNVNFNNGAIGNGTTNIGIIYDNTTAQSDIPLVKDCHFRFMAKGISVGPNTTADMLNVVNCDFYQLQNYGYYATKQLNGKILNSHFFKCGLDDSSGAIYLGPNQTVARILISNIEIAHSGGNDGASTSCGIYNSGVSTTVTGCCIVSCDGPGIITTGSANSITATGNSIYNNGYYTSGTDSNRCNIQLGTYCKATIRGNQLGGTSATTPLYNIYSTAAGTYADIEGNGQSVYGITTTFYGSSADPVVLIRQNNQDYIAPGEVRQITISVAGVSPAGIMTANGVLGGYANPFPSSCRVVSVDMYQTASGAAAGTICVGVGTNSTADYGADGVTKIFTSLPADTTTPAFANSLKTATYGTQLNPVSWPTTAFVTFYAHVTNVGYTGKATITLMGNL